MANGLLAPVRAGRPHGLAAHDGVIVTGRPNKMWGTDATSTITLAEGQATIFFAVDHCTAECVGIHAARRGPRFEALEPIRQGVREQMGAYDRDAANGLKLRHDHGSQFVSDHYQGELRFLGIEASPAFVREPEGNGCAERFVRTLKEQLLWIRTFETTEQLRLALHEFKVRITRSGSLEGTATSRLSRHGPGCLSRLVRPLDYHYAGVQETGGGTKAGCPNLILDTHHHDRPPALKPSHHTLDGRTRRTSEPTSTQRMGTTAVARKLDMLTFPVCDR